MIFKNNEHIAMDADKLATLKSVFPNFFETGDKFRAVVLRNTSDRFFTASKGRLGGTMKNSQVPMSGVTIQMKAISLNKDTYQNDQIIVSSTPPEKNAQGNVKYNTNSFVSMEDGTMIVDADVLYFLYFYYAGIANNAVEKKHNVGFEFIMAEKEQSERISTARSEAKMILAITETLTSGSVKDVLRTIGIEGGADDNSNRDMLMAAYKGDKKSEIEAFVKEVLVVASEEVEVAKYYDVQEIVEKAFENGLLKIADGKLYGLKKGSEDFSDRATLVLKTEDDDSQMLEVIKYFTAQGSKIESIIKE